MSVDEDERAALRVLIVRLPENLQQAVELGVFVADLDDLVDFRSDHRSAADGDLEGLPEDLAGERVHLPWERRGEEDGLAVGPDVVDDFHDLRLKTHVEHAVSFVQDEVRDALEVGDTT